MQIDVIDTEKGLAALAATWDAVYLRDPEATFFLSGSWLRQTLAGRGTGWCVLAAKLDSGSDYVAFFPLRIDVRWSRNRSRLVNDIHMAGSFAWADYTGFICDPAHEDGAIPALAEHLQSMRWTSLHLRHFNASPRRVELFTAAFDRQTFNFEHRRANEATPEVNNEICPYVDLPTNFDVYLREKTSANTRQKIRRFLRQVDGSTDFRISECTPESCERDLDVLVSFWKQAWAHRKGKETDHLGKRYRSILQQAMAVGALYLPVLWRGDAPLGALAHFVDRQKASLLYFVAGRDDAGNNPPPGLVLHAHSIRWAIANGLRTYDFLRGNESFKYSYGVSERRITNTSLRTRTGDNLHDKLDPSCVEAALQLVTQLKKDQHPQHAAAACQQLIEACPDHPAVLRRYSRLLYELERFAASQRLSRRLLELEPGDDSAWRLLGKALLAQHEFAQAEEALRKALTLRPTISGHFHLARALERQGKESQAAAEREAILHMSPRGRREQKQQRETHRSLGLPVRG